MSTKIHLDAGTSTALQSAEFPVVAHSAYPSVPWGRSAIPLANELVAAANAGLHGLVVHINRQTEESLAATFEQLGDLPSLDRRSLPILFLETPAYAGFCSDPGTLSRIMELAVAENSLPCQIGLCLDTAHLFAAGADMTTRDGVRQYMDALEWTGPLMVHLNDSATPRGSGIDRHAQFYRGEIWTESFNGGLREMIKQIRERDSFAIIERKQPGAVEDLHCIGRLAADG